jgi:hypothetical protein
VFISAVVCVETLWFDAALKYESRITILYCCGTYSR